MSQSQIPRLQAARLDRAVASHSPARRYGHNGASPPLSYVASHARRTLLAQIAVRWCTSLFRAAVNVLYSRTQDSESTARSRPDPDGALRIREVLLPSRSGSLG
ncbi:hypothetical protein MRB53_038670 [Persea americana]|nr:hypothetical protein MRB53_038670 [Persea americana]